MHLATAEASSALCVIVIVWMALENILSMITSAEESAFRSSWIFSCGETSSRATPTFRA